MEPAKRGQESHSNPSCSLPVILMKGLERGITAAIETRHTAHTEVKII